MSYVTSNNTRIKVRAIRAANGRIQGWAVTEDNWEIRFYSIRTNGDAAHIRALRFGNWYSAARAKDLATQGI